MTTQGRIVSTAHHALARHVLHIRASQFPLMVTTVPMTTVPMAIPTIHMITLGIRLQV